MTAVSAMTELSHTVGRDRDNLTCRYKLYREPITVKTVFYELV